MIPVLRLIVPRVEVAVVEVQVPRIRGIVLRGAPLAVLLTQPYMKVYGPFSGRSTLCLAVALQILTVILQFD